MNNFCEVAQVLAFFCLFEGGRYHWTHVSQPFLDKPKIFLGSLDRKFPEHFKIHPNFLPFALLRALESIELKILLFSMTLCSSFNWAPSSLRSIFYQMDHTCWAPSRLKKFPRLKIKSQWSFTLYRSLITTLYICEIWYLGGVDMKFNRHDPTFVNIFSFYLFYCFYTILLFRIIWWEVERFVWIVK